VSDAPPAAPQPATPPSISPALFWPIVATTAGFFATMSIRWWMAGVPLQHATTDRGLLWIVAAELVMAAVWIPVLRWRGWRLASVTRPLEPADLPRGAILWLIALMAYLACSLAASVVAPDFVRRLSSMQMGGTVSWAAVILLCLVNPLAEELMYLGLIANVLRAHGAALAVTVSVLARLAVHIYQGAPSLLTHVPYGLLMTLFYVSTRRLWPPVIAHAIGDFVGLAPLIGRPG
jgi:membrane protease YdiL (CAAX protease family)